MWFLQQSSVCGGEIASASQVGVPPTRSYKGPEEAEIVYSVQVNPKVHILLSRQGLLPASIVNMVAKDQAKNVLRYR